MITQETFHCTRCGIELTEQQLHRASDVVTVYCVPCGDMLIALAEEHVCQFCEYTSVDADEFTTINIPENELGYAGDMVICLDCNKHVVHVPAQDTAEVTIYQQTSTNGCIKTYCEACKPQGSSERETLIVSGYDHFCSGCGEDFKDIASKEKQAMATFTPGTLVVCQYRMPSVLQPWIHDIYVGVVVKPGIDPAQWNGSNSEQSYCEITGTLPVQYPFGIQHDKIESLIAITDKEAQYSFREKIAYFLGRVALTNFDRAMGIH